MSAADPPPGTKARRCPKHGVRHKWRIIDFELSLRTPIPPRECNKHYHDILETFLMHLSLGHR